MDDSFSRVLRVVADERNLSNPVREQCSRYVNVYSIGRQRSQM